MISFWTATAPPLDIMPKNSPAIGLQSVACLTGLLELRAQKMGIYLDIWLTYFCNLLRFIFFTTFLSTLGNMNSMLSPQVTKRFQGRNVTVFPCWLFSEGKTKFTSPRLLWGWLQRSVLAKGRVNCSWERQTYFCNQIKICIDKKVSPFKPTIQLFNIEEKHPMTYWKRTKL